LRSQPTIDENHPAVCPPWTPEENAFVCVRAGQLAFEKNVSIRLSVA
jgi:hypothetical protein